MRALDGARSFMRDVTGIDSRGCPWWAFYEPIVADVIELNRAVGPEGSPASVLALKPPAHLWEALLLYRRVSDHTRAVNDEEDERARRAREAAMKK